MLGFIVVIVLAVLIFIGFKNQKKIAQQKSTEEKVTAEQKEQIVQQKSTEGKVTTKQKEQKGIDKEKAIEAFWSSNNLDEELDYIFSVLEKNGATASNFEKGIEHFVSKTETTLTKEEIFPTMKKALFVRAFDNDNCAVAKDVATDYFINDLVKGEMFTQYMRFAVAKAKFPTPEMMEPFIKMLYGVAGRAFNYQHNRLQSKNYEVITPDAFKLIIEHSDVLKSYTDTDPFTTDTVREKWARDMYDSPLKMVRSSKWGGTLDKEECVDELCYLAYTILRKDEENSIENVSVSEIALTYSDFLKEIYDRINR